MSKALATVGKIAGVVGAVALTAGTLGAGSAATAALLTQIGTIASAAAGLSIIGSAAIAKKPPLLGSVSSLTIGADQPTPYMIGDTYIGGALVHQTGYGQPISKVPNPNLAMVVVMSVGGPIAGIDQAYADFEPIGFTGPDNEAVGYYSKILFSRTSLGPALQTTALSGPFGTIPVWGADAKLSGKAHALWSLQWDSKNGKYQGGAPQLGWRGRGVLTWDPRADSTIVGGSGPQRWADPADRAAFDAAKATWVYTARPGLHALRYALGTWERDLSDPASDYVLTFGIGMRLDQVVLEDFCALETMCEINDWEVSGVLYEPGDKAANLKRILAAGGAQIAWKGGRLGLSITSPRVSLDTIGVDDLADGDLRAPGMQPWRDRINAVIPKFRSPDHKWTMQQSTKIVLADAVVADGEEKLREQPFEMVKRADQAAQLAAYALWDAREQGSIAIPILPRLRGYHSGDRLTLDPAIVDALGLAQSEVVVAQRTFDPAAMTGMLYVTTETAAKHAAALAQTGMPPGPIVIPPSGDYGDTAAAVIAGDRVAHQLLTATQSVAYPVTSTATSIAIEAFNAAIDDGRRISFPAFTATGLTQATPYIVLWSLAAGSYAVIPQTESLDEVTSPDFVIVRYVSTASEDGTYPAEPTPPGGDGGSGYGGGRYPDRLPDQ